MGDPKKTELQRKADGLAEAMREQVEAEKRQKKAAERRKTGKQ